VAKSVRQVAGDKKNIKNLTPTISMYYIEVAANIKMVVGKGIWDGWRQSNSVWASQDKKVFEKLDARYYKILLL
jgi:hypothetical protein